MITATVEDPGGILSGVYLLAAHPDCVVVWVTFAARGVEPGAIGSDELYFYPAGDTSHPAVVRLTGLPQGLQSCLETNKHDAYWSLVPTGPGVQLWVKEG